MLLQVGHSQRDITAACFEVGQACFVPTEKVHLERNSAQLSVLKAATCRGPPHTLCPLHYTCSEVKKTGLPAQKCT